MAKNKEYYKEVKTVFCRHSILLAARFGKEELVAEHIAQGADLAARDKYGKIPFDYAKKDEVKTVFARHSLLAAAQFGKEELVAEHIAQGADLAACDGRGRTALLLASKGGHLAAVQLLLKAGADMAAKTKVSLKRETLTSPFADLRVYAHVACMRTCGV